MRRLATLFLFTTLIAAPAPAQEMATGPLARDLVRLFQTPRLRGATWGALVVSLTRGDTLFAYRPEQPLIPASNAKLFTTAAALRRLGPDYRFVTAVIADGPVRGGELFGDLVLYGTGDPTFALDTSALAPFADSVVLAGIRRVRGDLIGDASFLGPELAAPEWLPGHLNRPFAAPPSALSAAENRVRLSVLPGRTAGAPATVVMDPASSYFRVRNLVRTSAPGARSRVSIHRTREGHAVELRGTVGRGRRGWHTWLVVDEPALFAAGLLRQMLEARGVVVTGETRVVVDEASSRVSANPWLGPGGVLPGGALAVRRSAPLDEIVTMINHRSHNLSAELALRTLGRIVGGTGSYASGADVVTRFLTEEVGVPADQVRVSDGSGLSPRGEASPHALVQLLSYMRGAPEGGAFDRSLPLLGEGFSRRMRRTSATGRLRAKTGTLRDVSALSGYVTTAGGEELAFALIVNDARSVARARQVQDSIGARLARLDRSNTPPYSAAQR